MPIYKVKTRLIRKNATILVSVVHVFEASLAYFKIALNFTQGTCFLLKKPVFSQFFNAESLCKNFLYLKFPIFGCNCRWCIPLEKHVVQTLSRTKESHEIEFFGCPAGIFIRAICLLFLAIQSTFAFIFCCLDDNE